MDVLTSSPGEIGPIFTPIQGRKGDSLLTTSPGPSQPSNRRFLTVRFVMRCIAAAILALCVVTNTSNAAPEESFRLYSNICLNVESGDAHGVRIAIIKLVEGRYAFLQWVDGYPDAKPEVSSVSEEDLKSGKLVFSVPVGGKPAMFRGTITSTTLTGQFSPARPDDPKMFRLRRASPQKGFPDCVAPK